jgi:acylaminoacyl-peptidase
MFNLETLGQINISNDEIRLLKKSVDRLKNNYKSVLYSVSNKQTIKQNVSKNISNTKNDFALIDGIIYKNNEPIIDTFKNVSDFLVSDEILYFSVNNSNIEQIREKHLVPEVQRITTLDYRADGIGFLDPNAKYEIWEFKNNSFKKILLSPNPVNLLDVYKEKLLYTVAGNPSNFAEFNNLFIYDKQEIKELFKDIPNGKVETASFSKDGQTVALAGHDSQFHNSRIFSIYLIDLKTNISEKYFSEDEDAIRDIMSDLPYPSNGQSIKWINENEFIFQTTFQGHSRLYKGDINKKAEIYFERDEISITDFAIFKNRFFLIATMINNPSILFELKDRELIEIYNPNKNSVFNESVKISFKTSFNQLVHGWFMKSRKGNGKTIVYVHGGPHGSYSDAFFWEFQELNNLGYDVLFVNPEGSTSYGQEFENQVIGHYGENDFQTILDATDYAIQKFNLDEKNIYLIGGSYGGFMTTWAASHTKKFRAIVAQRAVTNWISLYGQSDIGIDFNQSELGIDLFSDGGFLEYWKRSPLAYAKDVDTPILLMHGEWDLRVPISQSEEFFTAVKSNTKTLIEFVRFPQSWHGISRSGLPNLRQKRIEIIDEWLSRF